MVLRVPHTLADAQSQLKSKLEYMLSLVDASLLTHQQKLRLYQHGICPCHKWLLSIYEYPVSWIERNLVSVATRFFLHWAGLAHSANVNILYLSKQHGSLNLTSILSRYKCLQVSRQCQLRSSADASVQLIAEKSLSREEDAHQSKFKPAVVVQSVIEAPAGPFCPRKDLLTVVKGCVQKSDEHDRFSSLKSLPKQGQMLSLATPDASFIWSAAVQSRPQSVFKFALNACLDTLPHNANLHLWKKLSSALCPLCKLENQSLIYVLNCCEGALWLRRFNECHDRVLHSLVSVIRQFLPPSVSFTADVDGLYQFPCHIVPTELRPDIVWWDDSPCHLMLVELTVCFETTFADVA